MSPFDQAWTLLKMPKEGFPYAYDPDQFSITHDFIDYDPSEEEYMMDDNEGRILQVAAHQGMKGLKGEDNVEPMKYGHASFYMDGDKLIPRTAFTHPSFRRWGLATDMYDYAEKLTGLPVVDETPVQSEDARKFWENRRRQS